MAIARFPDDRLLPAPIRRPAAALAAVCAAAFLVLAVIYHGSRTAGRVDGRLFALLPEASMTGRLDRVAETAPWVAFAVVVLTTTALLLAGRRRAAVFAAAGPGLAMLLAEGAKRVIDRTDDGFLAMPSGHTAGITSVAVTLAVLLLQRYRAHVVPAAALGWLGATLVGAAIALVMVILRAHYPTDTVGGYCLAVATVLGVAFAIDRVAARGPAETSASAWPASRPR